jgi:hypothetical protein
MGNLSDIQIRNWIKADERFDGRSHGAGPVREALFKAVESMCFDSQDTLFMYGDNMIRKMTRDGRVTTWAY